MRGHHQPLSIFTPGAAPRCSVLGILDATPVAAGASDRPVRWAAPVPITQDQLVIFAARSGNTALLEERLEAGGNLNVIDAQHGCALVAAIVGGHLEAVRLLCDRGADPNLVLGDSWGPLETALRDPDPSIVYVLVCGGAVLQHKARPHYARRLEQCLKQVGGTAAAQQCGAADTS